jgi:hypothetical protein
MFNMQSGRLHASLDRVEVILTHSEDKNRPSLAEEVLTTVVNRTQE